MAEVEAPVEDVDAVRRQIRAAVIARIRTRRRLARRRLLQLVHLAHVGRRW